jgi:hypothetical protein
MRFLFFALLFPAFAQDQVPKTLAASVGATLDFVEGQFLSVAEAMPESKYGFIPSAGNFEGVRSFGEQVKHADGHAGRRGVAHHRSITGNWSSTCA